MVDAYDVARNAQTHRLSARSSRGPILLAALIAVTIVLHGVPEVYGLQVYDGYSGSSTTATIADQVIPPAPSFAPTTPRPPDASPSAEPSVEPSSEPSDNPGQSPDGSPGTPDARSDASAAS